MTQPDHFGPSPRTFSAFAWKVKVISACAATLVIAGCSTSGDNPTATKQSTAVRNIIDAYQVASYWQPTPELNLMSPEGTFIRAALESDSSIINTRTKAAGYPGYPLPPDKYYVSDYGLEQKIDGTYTGASLYAVLDVMTPTRSSLRARVCSVSRIQIPELPPQEVGRIVFTIDIQKGPMSPPSGQTGAANRPAQNSFGDWRITSLKPDVLKKSETLEICTAAALESKMGQPSSPGWPSSGPPSASPTS